MLKLEWPELYYINGPETLPPPLSREEEDEVMERVRRGEKRPGAVDHPQSALSGVYCQEV